MRTVNIRPAQGCLLDIDVEVQQWQDMVDTLVEDVRELMGINQELGLAPEPGA